MAREIKMSFIPNTSLPNSEMSAFDNNNSGIRGKTRIRDNCELFKSILRQASQ